MTALTVQSCTSSKVQGWAGSEWTGIKIKFPLTVFSFKYIFFLVLCLQKFLIHLEFWSLWLFFFFFFFIVWMWSRAGLKLCLLIQNSLTRFLVKWYLIKSCWPTQGHGKSCTYFLPGIQGEHKNKNHNNLKVLLWGSPLQGTTGNSFWKKIKVVNTESKTSHDKLNIFKFCCNIETTYCAFLHGRLHSMSANLKLSFLCEATKNIMCGLCAGSYSPTQLQYNALIGTSGMQWPHLN